MVARSQSGASLIELMIALFLMSFVSAGIFGLATLNNQEGQKIFNKIDSLNAAREVIDTIGEDVRMARSVGDIYGITTPPTQQLVTPGAVHGPSTNVSLVNAISQVNSTNTLASSSFPSLGDPFYGNGQVPAGGWPAFPGNGTTSGVAGPPYTLGEDTLIIQVPIFDQPGAGGNASYPGGFPTSVKTTPQPVVTMEAMDTYVFQILPDPSYPGTYMMQLSGFPGVGNGPNGTTANSTMSINSTARTILKGIIGPLDSNGNVCAFQYIDKTNPTQPVTTVTNPTNISGVIVTLQILNNNASNNSKPESTDSQWVSVGFKSEMYMRNNTLADIIGGTKGQ
jgi:type II secretory pathway pseudopilin PulG